MNQLNSKNLKVKRILAQDQVFNEIKNLILNNTWKMGEKLPSESELSTMFGVNRLTIRIAIQKLNTIGITETRIGDGTYVIDFSMEDYINQVSDFYVKPKLIDDVYDFRKLIELECVKLAIENATPIEIEELYEISKKYSENVIYITENSLYSDDKYILKLAELDFEYHNMICKMSHNSLLEYSYSMAKNSIIQYLKAIIKMRYSNSSYLESIQKEIAGRGHWSIYNSIKEKDYETCKNEYLKMIDYKIKL